MKSRMLQHLIVLCWLPLCLMAFSALAGAGQQIWTQIGPLSSVMALGIGGDHLILAATANGLVRGGMDGTGWTVLNQGLPSTHVEALVVDPADSMTLYAGTREGVFKSSDGGDSWSPASNGLTSTTILTLAVDPVQTTTLYAGTGGEGVFKSSDGGASWSPINNGLLQGDISDGIIYSLALDPADPSTLYAGGWRGVFKSGDGGAQWTLVYSSLFGLIRSIAVDPHDSAIIYAGPWQGGLVHKSTDGGQTWSSYAAGSSAINALLIDSQKQNTLYAGTGSGVLCSTDGGESWSPFADGLAASEVLCLLADPENPAILYAGTVEDGLFRYDGAAQDSEAPLFSGRRNYPSGEGPVAVELADLNGDGITDLLSLDFEGDTLTVMLGSGGGSFQDPYQLEVGDHPCDLVIGDLNGDGRKDVAIANFYEFNKITLLLGTGTGEFLTSTAYTAGDHPASLAMGDFDGDGALDLAVANFVSDDVSVLLGNGDGSFRAAVIYAVGRGPVSLVAADFNGDGSPDLAASNFFGDTITILSGNGDGTFADVFTCWADDHPISLASGDLNGDGKADLAAANLIGNSLSVLIGNGDGTFQSPRNLGVGSEPASVAVGDVNGDGHCDLIAANSASDTISVLQGVGGGDFATQEEIAAGQGPRAVAVIDLDANGGADAVVANFKENDLSIFSSGATSALLSFTGLSSDLIVMPQAGESVTLNAEALSSSGGAIYYAFYLIPDYGTDRYDPFANWRMIRGFSTDPSLRYRFEQAGNYMVVVRASPVPYLINYLENPLAASAANPVIGASFSVGENLTLQFTSLVVEGAAAATAGESVTFEVDSLSAENEDLYYRFYLIAYGNGINDYPTSTGEIIQDFSLQRSCTYTFDEVGAYVVKVWASETAAMPDGAVPLIGETIVMR